VTTDLSASYAKAVRDGLPHAVLVANRFHVIHLANGMLTAVRQRVVREAEGAPRPQDRRGLAGPPPGIGIVALLFALALFAVAPWVERHIVAGAETTTKAAEADAPAAAVR